MPYAIPSWDQTVTAAPVPIQSIQFENQFTEIENLERQLRDQPYDSGSGFLTMDSGYSSMDSSYHSTAEVTTPPTSAEGSPESAIPLLNIDDGIDAGERLFVSFLNQDSRHRAQALRVMPELLDPSPEIHITALRRFMLWPLRRPMSPSPTNTADPQVYPESQSPVHEPVLNRLPDGSPPTNRLLSYLDIHPPEANEVTTSSDESVYEPNSIIQAEVVFGQVRALRAVQRLQNAPFQQNPPSFSDARTYSLTNPSIATPAPYNSPESVLSAPASLAGRRVSHSTAFSGIDMTGTNSYGVAVNPLVKRRPCTVFAVEVQKGDVLKYGNFINDGCKVMDCYVEERRVRGGVYSMEDMEDVSSVGGPVTMGGTVRIQWQPRSEVRDRDQMDVDSDDSNDGGGYRCSQLFEGMEMLQVLRVVEGWEWQ